jgi:hypothetical protein
VVALGFAGGPPGDAGRGWLAQLGPVHEDTIGPAPNGAVLGWAGTRPFDAAEESRLRQAVRCANSSSRSRPAKTASRTGVHRKPNGKCDSGLRAEFVSCTVDSRSTTVIPGSGPG